MPDTGLCLYRTIDTTQGVLKPIEGCRRWVRAWVGPLVSVQVTVAVRAHAPWFFVLSPASCASAIQKTSNFRWIVRHQACSRDQRTRRVPGWSMRFGTERCEVAREASRIGEIRGLPRKGGMHMLAMLK